MRVISTLRLSAALLFTLVTSVAGAQPPAPTQEQIDQEKKAAAAVSSSLSGLALKRDAEGNVQYDAQGKPITQRNDSNSMRDGMKEFQQTLGIESIEQVSSPSAGGRTGLANIKVDAKFDFLCIATPQDSTAGALAFRMSDCDPQRGVQIQLCENAAKGGMCTKDEHYTRPALLPPNVFSSMGSMRLGLACNDQNKCRLTVQGTYSVGGNDESIKQQTATVANTSSSNDGSYVGTLRETVLKDDRYAKEMREIGTPLKACADRNQNAMNSGMASSCDDTGSTSVGVATPQNKSYCTGTRECLREAVSTQKYTRTCTTTFPLTERISKLNYEKQLTCAKTRTRIVEEVEKVVKDEQGKDKTIKVKVASWKKSDSCGGERDEKGVLLSPDARDGHTRVGDRPEVCTRYEKAEDGYEGCVEATAYEYYVHMDFVKVLSQSASPSAVTGTCDTNPNSDTRHTTCNGNWFGRTLEASECVVQFVDGRNDQAVDTFFELNYANKYGCGFCITPDVGETCYGAPSEDDKKDSCARAVLDGCTFVSASPRNYTGESGTGLVASQEETYSCIKETRTCVSWSKGTGDSCLSTNQTFGLEDTKSQDKGADGSLNNALVGAAMLDSTGRGVEDKQDSGVIPKIFTGTDMRCKRATGGIGQLFGRNCCRTDLERPSSRQLTRRGCSMDEARLAAARRSYYAHYIGDYCSKKLRFPRRCLERTETYCTFPGILPRLVHEQGRDQLAAMAASGTGADIQRSALSFPYYDKAGGSWSAETIVNGVRMRAWQWPSYCANPESVANEFMTNPDAKECAGVLSTWFAACDAQQGCGELPREPQEGSLFWSLRMVDPLTNITSAVSRYSVVQGACSPEAGSCNYTVSAWPAGIGGKAVVSRDLNWPLYLNEQPEPGKVPANYYQINNIADFMFKGYSVVGMNNGQLPTTVQLGFSRDGGQTWTHHQLPTNQREQDFTLPDSDVRISGYCDALTNICGYRMSGTTAVMAKPWGTPEWPDCSGFTAGQLSAMDFGKMDLSEWLNTVLDKASGQTTGALAAQASKQFQEYNSIFSSGGTVQQTSSNPVSANFARVVPSEGFGPFDSRLVVSGYWPETTGNTAQDVDRVTAVHVDWGDCSPVETLAPATEGVGFRGVHRYEAPDSLDCLGNPEKNVTHKVKLTVYTSMSGVQNRTLQVENAWAVFPGGNKNNDFVGSRAKDNGYNSNVPVSPRP